MLDLSRARDRMVDVQIARRGVRDPAVLDAMRRVPREAFVEAGFEELAYEDGLLPIGEGQTISQPYIVALMIEAAEVKPGDSVLESKPYSKRLGWRLPNGAAPCAMH